MDHPRVSLLQATLGWDLIHMTCGKEEGGHCRQDPYSFLHLRGSSLWYGREDKVFLSFKEGPIRG